MVDVITSIQIKAPLKKVAEFAGNPDHVLDWYVNIKSIEWKTPKPLTVGSKIAFIAHFLGKKLSYVYEIKELLPSEKLVMQTADGPFPMETTYTWKKIDENTTEMTLRNKGNPSGFSKNICAVYVLRYEKCQSKGFKQIEKAIGKIILNDRFLHSDLPI